MDKDLIQRVLLAMRNAADAESMGYPDEYHELLAAYHADFDDSWMPGGYGMAIRDPSVPLRVDISSSVFLLGRDRSALSDFVSSLGKG